MPGTNGIVAERAAQIARAIQGAAQGSPTEAEFRGPVEEALAEFAGEAKVPLRTHHEYALGVGRADTVYNRLVIEYKRPGHLGAALGQRINQAALEQLRGYLEAIAREQRIKKARLAGVVTDGRRMIFARFLAGRWRVERPVAVDATSVGRLLQLLVQLQSGAALIPSNLIEDFGSDTLTAQRTTRALYAALQDSDEPLVGALFHQWQTFFGQVTGHGEAALRLRGNKEFRKFARGMGLSADEVEPPGLFFSVHTYFALLIKFIAWLTVSRYITREGAPFAALSHLPSDELQRELRAMERGGVFREYGLRNLLEGDFFGWYLRAWNPPIELHVRKMLGTLSRYDPGTLEVEPDLTRDLLKELYQYLVPRHLRHDLGEYYTPDWLAQRVLNMVEGGEYKGDPRKRVLDPACGSGTFLVLAIKAARAYCRQHNIPDTDALELILTNIVGIDLNPLAVVAARTNYLLALGELLQARGDEAIEIPIYLADSILTPAAGKDLFTKDTYPVPTSVGDFRIPRACATRERIGALATILDQCVRDAAVEAHGFLTRVRAEIGMSTAEYYAAESPLRDLYEQMAELHAHGMDGVWARIVKNAFAPIFLERFDYLVGNPPWVNWVNLPTEYRQGIAPLWQEYGLFPHTGLRARLGGAMDDVSILMLYVAVDRYLAASGKLGFVMPQTVFKSEGGGAGFRRFRLGSREPMKVLFVDDLSELQPFQGAKNRTSVVILQKGRVTSYPLPYNYWRKTQRGVSLSADMSLGEIARMTKRLQWIAKPVDPREFDLCLADWQIARPRWFGEMHRAV